MLKSGIAAISALGWLVFLADGLRLSSHSFGGLNFSRIRRQIGDVQCVLPPFPEHGQWKLLRGDAKPGDAVPISSVIIFECHAGFRVSTESAISVCIGQWTTPQFPECEKLCPPLYPSDTYNLKCIHRFGREIKCTEATHGTSLEYTCAPFYETPFGYKKTLFCDNDKWNYAKPVCQPICGKKIDDDKKTLIYGSKPEEKIKYPWVAAIFKKTGDSYGNICGGSVLSPTIVLTAAHCVTNHFGNTLPAENYLIGAGKLYNKYKAPEDEHAQYLQVWKILVPEEYKGDVRHFLGDIAVMVVKGEFTLTAVVQPVCFTNVNNIHLHAGHKGEVAGWGLAEGDKPSEVLRSLEIPYKYETVCADELPTYFADKYNLKDKICAGFINQSTGVCKGDSGSGFAFKYREDNRYYIHGIVSLAPKQGVECDIQQNSLYTRVASYYDFVEGLLTKYAPKVKDCMLPSYPQNGTWTADHPDRKPGDIVPSSTIVTLQCDEGFRLSSFKAEIECSSSHKMPTCEKPCPEVLFPKGSYHYCTDRSGQTIDCSQAIDGSNLKYFCPARYKIQQDSNNSRTCSKGSWGTPQPKCVRPSKSCGEKLDNVFHGTTRIGLESPWTVGIYKFSKNAAEEYEYSCGGSIISLKIVLTSAQCVTDKSGIVLPKDIVSVAAGKSYVKYNDSRDLNAQYAKLLYIIMNPILVEEGRVVPDMAILVTETSFTFNGFVQPVCFSHYEDIEWQPNIIGVMNRWSLREEPLSSFEDLNVSLSFPEYCAGYLSESIKIEFILDKSCGQFDNSSICMQPSDSGNGIVAKNAEDNRYYLYGVVSLLTDSDCDAVWYSDIARYFDSVDCIETVFE